MRVRSAKPSDATAIVDLRSRLFTETKFLLLESTEYKNTIEQEREILVSMESNPNSIVLLAETGDTIIGWLSVSGGRSNRVRHSASLALGVAKPHWRKGVASAMLQEAMNWAERTFLTRIELTVQTGNYAALTVYLRFGFQVEGMKKKSLIVDGNYCDEYLMARLLLSK